MCVCARVRVRVRVCTRARRSEGKQYLGTVAASTAAIVMANDDHTQAGQTDPALSRIEQTLLGSVVVVAVFLAMWPGTTRSSAQARVKIGGQFTRVATALEQAVQVLELRTMNRRGGSPCIEPPPVILHELGLPEAPDGGELSPHTTAAAMRKLITDAQNEPFVGHTPLPYVGAWGPWCVHSGTVQ